jgi:predicted MPP superfamily phosphohydrolase
MPWGRSTGMTLFFVFIPLLVLSLQGFLYWKTYRSLKEHFRAPRWAQRTIAALFLLFDLALVLILVLRPDIRKFPEWFQITGVYPFLLWHASGFFLGFILAVWALLSGCVKLFLRVLHRISPIKRTVDALAVTPEYQRFDASRRTFLRRSAYGLAAMTVAGTSYGMLVGRNQYEVTMTEIPIKGLPPQFDGFVIGLVSDIHAGTFMSPEQMRQYVKIVNDLGADLLALPGDFVTWHVDEVYPFAEAFSHLKAPEGVYGVLGNHDFYSGNPDRVAEVATGAGIRILRDEALLIRRGTAVMAVAGVDDVGRNNRAPVRLDRALVTVAPGLPIVLLCHRPYYLQQAAERNVGLMLSGHTHGGQIVLGRFGNATLTPAAFASPYVSGVYRSAGTSLYVTRGIGTVGLPMRVNCPAEISRIVLRAS